MKAIWKFALPDAVNDVDMPTGAEILTAQTQNGEVCIWALVETTAIPETRTFAIYGTGHPVTGNGTYIGTLQLADGALVWHLFEETKS